MLNNKIQLSKFEDLICFIIYLLFLLLLFIITIHELDNIQSRKKKGASEELYKMKGFFLFCFSAARAFSSC